jgi:hypothetical protein
VGREEGAMDIARWSKRRQLIVAVLTNVLTLALTVWALGGLR